MFWAHHHFSILYMFFGGSPVTAHHTFFRLLSLFFVSSICLFGFGRLATYSLVRSLVHSLANLFYERTNAHSFAWHSSTTRETSQSLDAEIYVCTEHYIWQNWTKRLYALLNWQQQLWISCERVRVCARKCYVSRVFVCVCV